MNGGALIAQVLKAHGVRHLYTLSGGHVGPIYVEAEHAGIQVIDVRHEATAVFAADAEARLSGIPGVAVVTAGPGVTNTITALKNAQLAQSPVILFGGATATLLRGRGALQDIDQISILRSVVKTCIQTRRVRDLAPAVEKAFRVCQAGVPGPVFIECPVDLLYPEEIVREWYGAKNDPGGSLVSRLTYWYINKHVERLFSGGQVPVNSHPSNDDQGIREQDIQACLGLLSKARKPVMVIGSGALNQPGLADDLALAVKGLDIPVWLSGMARGLLGEGHPLHFLHARKRALREADLIMLAGVAVDFRLDYGRHLNRHARIMTLHRDASDLKRNVPRRAWKVKADPAEFLIRLAGRDRVANHSTEWKERLAGWQEERELAIREMATETMEGINPVSLFRVMDDMLPEDVVLVADGGDFAATASYTIKPRKALHWLDPGVYGTLGVGGGFALGAALHYPEDEIWIIYGDGSAGYSLAELDIFAKHGLKVCAVIGNNASWEQIARDQRTMLGSGAAIELRHSDYHLVSQAFGGAGERVDDLEAFRGAVQRAREHMNQGIPYVINAIIGRSDFRKGSISM